MRLK
jgi:3-oxoacid CoA-transferase B subunit